MSLADVDLVAFIRLLDPTLATQFAIGPTSYLLSNA